MRCRWIALQSAALALVMSGWAGLPAGLASSTIRSSRLWTDASEEVAPSNIDVAPELVTANDAAPPVTDLAATESSDLDSVLGAEEQVSCQPGCCGECNSGCACRKKCVCQRRLLGLIAPSDPCFREFISPLTNPLFFEDPRTLTEARTIYAHQWIPAANPVFGGGQAQYVATQMRAALTKRLSLIATKDGYFWIDPASPARPASTAGPTSRSV